MKIIYTIEAPQELAEDSLATLAVCHGWTPQLTRELDGKQVPFTIADYVTRVLTNFVIDSIMSKKTEVALNQARVIVDEQKIVFDQLVDVTMEIK